MVLGEQLGWEVFIGRGIIFTGLIKLDGRLLKQFKNPGISKIIKY